MYEYPEWLIDTCYLKVGDSAEVITLLLKNKITTRKKELSNISLNELLSKIIPELSKLNEEEINLQIKNIWETLAEDNHLIFNKILTGTFRVGVSIGLITKSISKLINIDEENISHRLMGNFEPSINSYEFLINKNINLQELNSKLIIPHQEQNYLLYMTFSLLILGKIHLLILALSSITKHSLIF